MEKPAKPPEWMDRATYEQLPEKLTVREARVRVCQKGFRVKTMILVAARLNLPKSTLLDERVR